MDEIQVILVDNHDFETGLAEKTFAHEKGLLHRAVSVFIVTSKGEWLLQKRAVTKYHSAGLWTNACCTHPLPGETTLEAATRRLEEEMGLQCYLNEVFSFIYNEPLENGLTEHEFDYVFIGISDKLPNINNNEVDDFRFIGFDQLQTEIVRHPDQFTIWFRKIYERVKTCLDKQNG